MGANIELYTIKPLASNKNLTILLKTIITYSYSKLKIFAKQIQSKYSFSQKIFCLDHASDNASFFHLAELYIII